MRTTTFHISGMHCASCAANIARCLQKTPGVMEAEVNYANEQATVTVDETCCGDKDLSRAVEKLGYKAHVGEEGGEDIAERERKRFLAELKRKLGASVILTLPLFVLKKKVVTNNGM